jgi:hypothetical protein
MPADIGGKSPLRDGSNEESILAENKQTSSLIQFKACAPALHLARRVTDIPRRAVAAGSSATTGNRRAQDRTGAALVALVGEALVFTGEGF